MAEFTTFFKERFGNIIVYQVHVIDFRVQIQCCFFGRVTV